MLLAPEKLIPVTVASLMLFPKESAGVLKGPPRIMLEARGGQKMLQEVREKSEPSRAKGGG